MRTLGVVLAGGQSRRFGSDKAAAVYRGTPLLDRALAALARQCDACAIVGRDSPLAPSIADWPRAGLGPLGGLAGALRHAQAHGFDQVMTAPVDCVDLPVRLIKALAPAPAYLAEQPVIGLWPVEALPVLALRLEGEQSRSVRGFAAAIGARGVQGFGATNVNTRDDLARLEARP